VCRKKLERHLTPLELAAVDVMLGTFFDNAPDAPITSQERPAKPSTRRRASRRRPRGTGGTRQDNAPG
jgi:hypothetical protein